MSNEAYFLAHNSTAATGNTLDSVASELDPAHPNIIGPGCSKGNKSTDGKIFFVLTYKLILFSLLFVVRLGTVQLFSF